MSVYNVFQKPKENLLLELSLLFLENPMDRFSLFVKLKIQEAEIT